MTTTYQNIRTTILRAKKRINTVVHHTIVETYWQIGKYIVEEEQNGENRATYGKALIANLAEKLKEEFGSAYSERNLLYMKKFYILFPILNALRSELSWTHYRILLRVENKNARAFYIQETIENDWSTRALNRQINSLYYERLLSSGERKAVVAEM